MGHKLVEVEDSKGKQLWENTILTEVINLFDLHKLEGPRLWIPPPAAAETVMEVFNEDIIAHPKRAHVFVDPRLMAHL